jgi:hypothetical protein
MPDTCSNCGDPLIDIDHYGERLIGCIECNRWSWRGSKRLFIELRGRHRGIEGARQSG